jgi:hypothetical protein
LSDASTAIVAFPGRVGRAPGGAPIGGGGDDAGLRRCQIGSGTPTPVPALPEPETHALMLAGLGPLGAAARRRSAGPAH